MPRYLLVLLLTVTALSWPPGPVAAFEGRVLQPLMWGWERHFAVEYEPGLYHGRPVVEGTVTNVSPYSVISVRLLIDSLDANGQLIAQKVAYLPGDMPGGAFGNRPAAAEHVIPPRFGATHDRSRGGPSGPIPCPDGTGRR